MSSSSSSSSSGYAVELYTPVIVQNHSGIIPFGFFVESGFVDSSVINFTIESISQMNNNEIVANLFASGQTSASETYIPEDESCKSVHNPLTYVDVIAQDASGIKEISVRTQKEIYGYEIPNENYVFNIPKFAWDYDDEEESSEEKTGYVWLGTSDKTMSQVHYDSSGVSIVNTISNTTSEIYKIYFNPNDSDMYVSGYDHLARYNFSVYKNSTEINEMVEVENDNTLISWANSSAVYSTDSYSGKVIIADKDTFETISEISGFDAPFKVVYSIYHGYHFVAGTNILWKLYANGTKTPVYSAKGYKIVDIDVAENGMVCILLSGNVNTIRVLDKNLYSMVVNKEIANSILRFCKYCGKGIFYVLVEINSSGSATSLYYQSRNYVVDTIKKEINDYPAASNVVSKVEDVVFPELTKKIELHSPIGGETWLEDSTQVIKWGSTESINDAVSIELIKGTQTVGIISANNTNAGQYTWTISNTYAIGTDYKIKVTWLAAGNGYSDTSNSAFTITNVAPIVVPQNVQGGAIGIDYSVYNNTIVIALKEGYLGMFDLDDFVFHGLYDSGTKNVLSMAVKDGAIAKISSNSKIRVFVGSDVYLSDMWDSGEITTNKKSIYYAGKRLAPGKKYYVNLQTYSDKLGWSDVQTREFIMPK